MQSWGAQREVEKVKPPTGNKSLTVESDNCRFTIRAKKDDGGGMSIWLGMDRDSLPEFIIGLATTADGAISDAVESIEAIALALQARRYPEDWDDDHIED